MREFNILERGQGYDTVVGRARKDGWKEGRREGREGIVKKEERREDSQINYSHLKIQRHPSTHICNHINIVQMFTQ
jgi:hypothetical protein